MDCGVYPLTVTEAKEKHLLSRATGLGQLIVMRLKSPFPGIFDALVTQSDYFLLKEPEARMLMNSVLSSLGRIAFLSSKHIQGRYPTATEPLLPGKVHSIKGLPRPTHFQAGAPAVSYVTAILCACFIINGLWLHVL